MDLILLACMWIAIAVVSIGAGSAIAWFRDELKAMRAKTWAPQSHTRDDPAVQITLARLAQARQNMRTKGIQTLLDGRRAYRTVKPMASESPKQTVIPMKRRPR